MTRVFASTDKRTQEPGAGSVCLLPTDGPTIGTIEIGGEHSVTLGRSSSCTQKLDDQLVSRRHCTVHRAGGTWFVTDLGSTHGTFVNGVRVGTGGDGASSPIASGDMLTIGPWTFRVIEGRDGENVPRVLRSVDDPAYARVQVVSDSELESVAQNQLGLLTSVATAIAGITDRRRLSETILGAALAGTGFPRAAIVKQLSGNEVEVVCSVSADGSVGELEVSKTLLMESKRAVANDEQAVLRLTGDGPANRAHSVVSLGIERALCAPIVYGGTVVAYLYLDARTSDRDAGARRGDAAAFCRALVWMTTLASQNISRIELAARNEELLGDLRAAREAQQLIMPDEEGRVRALEYAVRLRSGRYVAGDLFDILDLPGGRVGVFLGDVSGKGVGAAIFMATAQTHLATALRRGSDVADAVREVNRFIHERAKLSRFITLWVGVYDPATARMSYVDAGHGYALLVRGGRGVDRVEGGGIPIGIQPDYEYRSLELALDPGARLVLFSDGAVEQPSADGEQFGIERIAGLLSAGAGPSEDVSAILNGVVAHAGTDQLADDTTVASVRVRTG